MSDKRLQKGASAPNVVDLAEFRRLRAQGRPTLFYVSEGGDWMELLQSYRLFEIRTVTSRDTLDNLLRSEFPDVIFVESWLTWSEPLRLIRELADAYEVPIVLSVRDEADPECTRQQIKAAYAAGVSDTLKSPLCHEELKETLEVLVKLQTQYSLYH